MLSIVTLAWIATLGPAPAPPAIGSRVPDFALSDVNDRQHSLYGFKGKRAVVVVFVSAECPISNLYQPTLVALNKEFAAKQVQFLTMYSNDQDDLPSVIAHVRERKLPFPAFKDVGHKAADALGARRTPEAFLLDSEHIIRYRGRIDDQYGYTYRRPAPTHKDLKAALEELLAGKPITTAETEVLGCVIGRDSK
jgi:peroxiredoxin